MEQSFEKELNELALRFGVTDDERSKYANIDQFLPVLEQIRRSGAVVVIKLDGQRIPGEDTGPYTVVISGGALRDDFIRIDDDSLENALLYSIRKYSEASNR